MLTGFALVIAASLFQGSFILPMTLVRKWRWEQTWLTFSLMGMLALNWLLGLLLVPDLIPTLASAPMSRAALLGLFGAGWGLGAVLFGLAMDRMGMSLGYPIIMGSLPASERSSPWWRCTLRICSPGKESRCCWARGWWCWALRCVR